MFLEPVPIRRSSLHESTPNSNQRRFRQPASPRPKAQTTTSLLRIAPIFFPSAGVAISVVQGKSPPAFASRRADPPRLAETGSMPVPKLNPESRSTSRAAAPALGGSKSKSCSSSGKSLPPPPSEPLRAITRNGVCRKRAVVPRICAFAGPKSNGCRPPPSDSSTGPSPDSTFRIPTVAGLPAIARQTLVFSNRALG